jgi:hypothetical protein
MFLLSFLATLAALPETVPAQETAEELTVNSATLGNQGQELGAGSEQDRLANIFKLQKQLVYDLLRQAGINPDTLPPEVKKAIDKPHTKNLKAFLAFAEGLDQMDQGNYKAAEAKFKEAVALDPDFALAQELLDTVPNRTLEPNQIADLMRTGAAGAPAKTPQDPTGSSNDANTFFQDSLNNRTTGNDTDKKVSDQQPQVVTTTVTQTPPIVVTPPVVVTPPPPDVTPPVVVPPPIVVETPPPLLGFYAALVGFNCGVEGCGTVRNPYIGGGNIVRGGTFDVPQVLPDPGFLRASVDTNGRLTALTEFRHEFSTVTEQINPAVQLTRDRLVNVNLPSLEVGFYSGQAMWQSDNGDGGTTSNQLLFGNIAFAEGTPTPAAALADLTAAQASAFYSGNAGAYIASGTQQSFCASCGSFSMNLNFGANQASGFNLSVAPPGGNSIQISQLASSAVPLDAGRFTINSNDASFTFGVTEPGPVPPQGVVHGGTFGPRAESVGGTFVIQDATNQLFSQGHFGGIQSTRPPP